MFKKEVLLASHKFYTKLNHLSIISNNELPSFKERKQLWYRLVCRKIKRKTRFN